MKAAIIVFFIGAVLSTGAVVRANEPDDPSLAEPIESEAETPEGAMPEAGQSTGWGLGQIARAAGQLSKLGDWDNQVPSIEKSLDRFWQENDWNEEADLFALEAVRGVAEIPPWEISRRVEFLTGEFGERYGMSQSQVRELQTQCYRMIGSIAVRHGGTMFEHISEMVEGLLSGEPVTPEDVARWMEEGEGAVDFAHEQIESITEQIAKDMTDSQRGILMQDLASYRKRMERFEDMRERWKAGGWHPRDWALEEVPEYKEMMAERVRDGRYDEKKWQRFDELQKARRAYELKSQETRYNESAWERYVREFIARYALDDAQAETAWSILREKRQVAIDIRRSERWPVARTPIVVPLSERSLERIKGLFEELCRRLDRIPTNAQKIAAESALHTVEQSPSEKNPSQSPATPVSKNAVP